MEADRGTYLGGHASYSKASALDEVFAESPRSGFLLAMAGNVGDEGRGQELLLPFKASGKSSLAIHPNVPM